MTVILSLRETPSDVVGGGSSDHLNVPDDLSNTCGAALPILKYAVFTPK